MTGNVHTWQEALDAFERMLDDIDAQLDNDDWDDAVPQPVARPIAVAPTAAEELRLHELLGRARACQARLSVELATTQTELDGMGKRRRAATSYTQGDGFPATA